MIGSLNVGVNLEHPLWQFAHLGINYDEGATVTVNNGSTTLTAPDMSGYWEAPIPFAGIWLVTSTKDGESVNKSIEILKKYETYSISVYFITEWSQSFSYTGTIESVVIPVNGLYKMDIYGAAGGRPMANGSIYGVYGQGGHSIGYQNFTKGTILYICIGGAGQDGVRSGNAAGGYNGGGNGTWDNSDDESAGAGGGCTHIATMTGTLASIGAENLSKVLIVAGGAGGGAWHTAGGAGGGTTAGQCGDGRKATTTSGYAFGQGQNASGTGDSDGQGGGGGGLYGGYEPSGSGEAVDYGGGGSGYIDGCLATVTYQGTTYTSTTSQGGGTGNGSATITLIK